MEKPLSPSAALALAHRQICSMESDGNYKQLDVALNVSYDNNTYFSTGIVIYFLILMFYLSFGCQRHVYGYV